MNAVKWLNPYLSTEEGKKKSFIMEIPAYLTEIANFDTQVV